MMKARTSSDWQIIHCLQVVVALGEKSREHIPYRSSKLTHILKDSLGGTSSTSLIACVWSEDEFAHETLCTCKFAARMARLKTEAKRNVINEASTQVRALAKIYFALHHSGHTFLSQMTGGKDGRR